MPIFSKEQMKTLCDEVLVLSEKLEELEVASHETTGETRSAYAIVHKDMLWKITVKVGHLWHYLCGVEDMNPFEMEAKNVIVDVSGNTQ